MAQGEQFSVARDTFLAVEVRSWDSAGGSPGSSLEDSTDRLSNSRADCRLNRPPNRRPDGFPNRLRNRRLNGSLNSGQDCPHDSTGDCPADGHLHSRLYGDHGCTQDNLGNGLRNRAPADFPENLQYGLGDEVGEVQER